MRFKMLNTPLSSSVRKRDKRMNHSPDKILELLLKILNIQFCYGRLNQHHYVFVPVKVPPVLSQHLPDVPLDPVSDDSILYTPSHLYPKFGSALIFPQKAEDDQLLPFFLDPMQEGLLEIRFFFDADAFGISFFFHGERSFRPVDGLSDRNRQASSFFGSAPV